MGGNSIGYNQNFEWHPEANCQLTQPLQQEHDMIVITHLCQYSQAVVAFFLTAAAFR